MRDNENVFTSKRVFVVGQSKQDISNARDVAMATTFWQDRQKSQKWP